MGKIRVVSDERKGRWDDLFQVGGFEVEKFEVGEFEVGTFQVSG